jgi:hypothetical protein
MLHFIFFGFLIILHTISLWDHTKFVAGYVGDSLAHAAIPKWFCEKVVTFDFYFKDFMAPFGVNLAGNYDSPFPFILTCPAQALGSVFQFNLFAAIQAGLIVFSALMLARKAISNVFLQYVYVFFVWFSGFYMIRALEHITLLSMIWGAQLLMYSILSVDVKSRKSVFIHSCLMGLALAGTYQNIVLILPILMMFMVYQIKNIPVKNILVAAGTLSVIFLIFWLPMLMGTLSSRTSLVTELEDFSRKGSSTDLAGLILPDVWHYTHTTFAYPKLSMESSAQFDFLITVIFLFAVFSKQVREKYLVKFFFFVTGFYIFIGLGPTVKFNGAELFSNPINEFIYSLYPFKLTRNPGRAAAFAQYLMILAAFIFLDAIEFKKKANQYLLYGSLAGYIFLIGPFFHSYFRFPAFNYTWYFLPVSAMETIKNDPEPEAKVVPLPSDWGRDPTNNFLWLFHEKPVTSVYLAYSLYNEDLIAKTKTDPFLSSIACNPFEPPDYRLNPLMYDDTGLQMYLKENGYKYFTIHLPAFEDVSEGCPVFNEWVQNFTKKPWIKLLEENLSFKVYALAY